MLEAMGLSAGSRPVSPGIRGRVAAALGRGLPRVREIEAAVSFEPWRPRFYPLVLSAALVFGLLGGMVISALPRGGIVRSNEWHLWTGWEKETLPSVLFRMLGIGPDPNEREGTDAIRTYFRLTSQIAAVEPSDSAEAEALTKQRDVYENTVERYVAGLIDEAVVAAGLQRRLPLFSDLPITWPPVNFELTAPPQLLIRSPRNAILRAGDTLMRNDLTAEQAEAVEKATDDAETVSIVEPIGGLAAYPAVVTAGRSFDGWMNTTAHEWVHHYLAFFPLGATWGSGGDSITLNETTANIAGQALANIIRAKHPLQLAANEDGRAPAITCNAPPIDFFAEMRGLRLQVDGLLAAGQVTEAERAMEAKRVFLGEHCIAIRKLNQAYFAFHGSYADTAAASDPIGPKIERVRKLTGDVGTFLRVMRDVTNVRDLDSALAILERTAAPP